LVEAKGVGGLTELPDGKVGLAFEVGEEALSVSAKAGVRLVPGIEEGCGLGAGLPLAETLNPAVIVKMILGRDTGLFEQVHEAGFGGRVPMAGWGIRLELRNVMGWLGERAVGIPCGWGWRGGGEGVAGGLLGVPGARVGRTGSRKCIHAFV